MGDDFGDIDNEINQWSNYTPMAGGGNAAGSQFAATGTPNPTTGDTSGTGNPDATITPSLWDKIQSIGGKLGNLKAQGQSMQSQPSPNVAAPQVPVGQAAVHTPQQGGGSLLQMIFGLGGLNGQ